MEKSEIIRELQTLAKYHYAEGAKCEKAASDLSDGADVNTITGNPNKYPDYQTKWEPLAKIKYIEAIHNRFWPLTLMEEMLIEIEGKEQASITFPQIQQFAYRAVRECDLIRMRYEGTRSIFYSTQQNWVEHKPEEPVRYQLIDHYAPNPVYLQKLSIEQLSPEKIRWEGIK